MKSIIKYAIFFMTLMLLVLLTTERKRNRKRNTRPRRQNDRRPVRPNNRKPVKPINRNPVRPSNESKSPAKEEFNSLQQFCWRDSYGRGVGKIPGTCSSSQDKIGALCYPKCPQGYTRFGFDCHSNCPPASEGWRDDGLFCRKAEYGRGAGYPWKWGDGLGKQGMLNRCKKDNPQGCEMWGAIAYPKCRNGFHNFLCCVCRPDKPRCSDYNLNSGIDLSCGKKIIIGTPHRGGCNAGEVYDAGLCYKECNAGYTGVGPVCWGDAPKGFVKCGMGAAASSTVCASTTFSQVSSVGNLAFNIATMGASGTATAAANSANSANTLAQKFPGMVAKINELKSFMEKNKKAIESLQNYADIASKLNDLYGVAENTNDMSKSKTILAEDVIRISATLAGLVDPTGVSGVVAAYSYPKCSKMFPNKN